MWATHEKNAEKNFKLDFIFQEGLTKKLITFFT